MVRHLVLFCALLISFVLTGTEDIKADSKFCRLVTIEDGKSLAEALSPVFVFSEEEPTTFIQRAFLYQTFVRDDMTIVTWTLVTDKSYSPKHVIIYKNPQEALYPTEVPIPALLGELVEHWGDAETLKIAVSNEGEGQYRILYIQIKQHVNSKWYVPGDTEDGFECLDGHPVIYVSAGTHAMFPSIDECLSRVEKVVGYKLYASAENCDEGEYSQGWDDAYSVGYDSVHIDPFVAEPLASRFPGESAWRDDHCFFGGAIDKVECKAKFMWEEDP